MNENKQQTLISNNAIDMYESLRTAMNEAGGSFKKDYIMNMKADELISLLCTNNIRFVFKLEDKKDWYKNKIKNLLKENEQLKLELEFKNQKNDMTQILASLYKKMEEIIKEKQDLQSIIENLEKTNKQLNKDLEYVLTNSFKDLRSKFDSLQRKYDKLLEEQEDANKSYETNEYDVNFLQDKVDELKRTIFQLENSLDHSYSAEEVTEKIDTVVQMCYDKCKETVSEYKLVKELQYDILHNLKTKLKGNWKYNL